MTDGTTMTALEIQREFLAAVHRYLDSGGWERDDRPDIERCVALWERVLDAVESGDHESIAADIDWAAKLRLIRQVQEKSGVDLDHPRLSQIGEAPGTPPLKVSDGTLPTVALTDPFAHEDPRVDELVAALGR